MVPCGPRAAAAPPAPGAARLTAIKPPHAPARTMGAFPVADARTMPRFSTLVATILVAMLPAAAPAADPDRGRELYDGACVGCHGRSVHARARKSVRSCAELRATVARFATLQGRNWDADDLDDVSTWLNLRYYGFPSQDERCLASAAAGRAARTASLVP